MDKYKIHEIICGETHDLYVKKNNDYGDSFGKARKEIPYYTLSKLFDKFSRYKNLTLGAERKVDDETIEDTLLDMANYCLMEVTELRHASDRYQSIDITTVQDAEKQFIDIDTYSSENKERIEMLHRIYGIGQLTE